VFLLSLSFLVFVVTIVTLYSALEVTLRYLLHYKLTILHYITDLFARHATIGNDITLL